MANATEMQEGLALRRSVKIERYAEVLAHVVHFGTERAEEVVRRFGFTLAAWRAVDAAWTDDLAEGVRRNQQDLALRFSATLAKQRRRLARDQPALEAVGDAGAASAPAPASGAPVTAAPVALPSFMAAPQSAPARVSVVEVEAPGGGAAASVRAAPAPASRPAGEKPITQAMPVVSAAPDPLPFAEGVSPEAALRAAIDHAETVQGPKPARPQALGITAPSEGERIAAIARRILPFQPGAAGRDSTPPRDGAGAVPARDGAAGRESDPGAPPVQPADGAPGLTLEQHASLHVELALHPDQKGQTLRRYGLSAEQHARLDAVWQAKIAQDPAVRATWEAACGRYRSWILLNKP